MASLLWTLSVPAQQPQPADAAVADDYCDAVIQKWDLLFQRAPAAATDIETGLADLDACAERLAIFGEDRVNDLTEQLKAGARAQCIDGVHDTLSEVPLPPRLW